jgi:DNA-binding FadR family transcriptional regulator
MIGYLPVQVEEGYQSNQAFHNKILEGLVRHDPSAARLAIKEHLAQVHADLGVKVDAGM